jgi:hypothetical protein
MLHSVIEEHQDMLRELTCPQRIFPRVLSNRFQIATALIVELEPQPQILLKWGLSQTAIVLIAEQRLWVWKSHGFLMVQDSV